MVCHFLATWRQYILRNANWTLFRNCITRECYQDMLLSCNLPVLWIWDNFFDNTYRLGLTESEWAQLHIPWYMQQHAPHHKNWTVPGRFWVELKWIIFDVLNSPRKFLYVLDTRTRICVQERPAWLSLSRNDWPSKYANKTNLAAACLAQDYNEPD